MSSVDSDMPSEIDFRKGVRGLHSIPPGAKVMMPVSSREVFGSTSPGKLNSAASSFPNS